MLCMAINVFFGGLVGATSDALALNGRPDRNLSDLITPICCLTGSQLFAQYSILYLCL